MVIPSLIGKTIECNNYIWVLLCVSGLFVSTSIWRALKFKWNQKECCSSQTVFTQEIRNLCISSDSHIFFRSLYLQILNFLILPLGCYDWDCCLSGLKTISGIMFFSLTEVMMIFIPVMRNRSLPFQIALLRWWCFWTLSLLRLRELITVKTGVKLFLKSQ